MRSGNSMLVEHSPLRLCTRGWNRSRLSLDAHKRRGAATVELAICLPVLITLVFGAIETSNMIFTKQAVTAAAYEGARNAIRPNSTSSEAEARIQEVITARRVRGTSVSIQPSEVSALPRGTPITVVVSARCNANTVGLNHFFKGRRLRVRVTMVKE